MKFERMFDPLYNYSRHRTREEVLEDSEVIGFIKDDFKNNRETFTRVHKVTQELPNCFMKVICAYKHSPNNWGNRSGVYYFNPLDKTFRTKKGRNKTSKIHAWREA